MAITRAQQFRQMLEDGGMLVQPSMTGKRPGYRGDAAARSSGAADSGRVGGSDVGESNTSSDSRDDGPDDRGSNEQNINQRAVQRAARVRDIENYIDRPTFGFTDAAKFNIAPFPIKILQGLADIFPSGGTPRPPVQTMGGGGDGSQMQTIPLWAQLGFNSEAEYLESLAAQQETETEDQDERFLAFRANGGRIGFRGGDAARSDAASGRNAGRADPSGGVERPGGGGGDGDDRPTRKSDNQKTPVVVNPIKNLQKHFDNNQKLKDAVALGLITNDEYNVLGGYDAKQTLGMGPIDTGLSSLGYNVVQSIKGDQPFSDIFGDVSRNVKGATNISPELQTKYENIMQMADGGRIGAAEGGIMDLETGRQMYFLGKLVKKATKAVKKVVKSPIGKAALIGAIGFGIPGVSSGFFSKGLAGTKFGLGAKNFLANTILGTPVGDFGTTRTGGILEKALGFVKDKPFEAITAASAVAGLLTATQEQEAQQLADNTGIDIEEARNQILRAAAGQDDFRARAFKADGGIMRAGYQEGSKEPVAKKTMPLLDMGGKEMDLREDGGFVPIGRMEKADDVPARLSKNEFVFTADAVRNAGDGNVDKGAEVMYNMMKNLESGGDVSEESQGLEGAREMFQTSQRLEEVL